MRLHGKARDILSVSFYFGSPLLAASVLADRWPITACLVGVSMSVKRGRFKKIFLFFFGLGILIDIDDIMLELNGKNLRRPARRNSLKIFDLAPASSKNCIMSLF